MDIKILKAYMVWCRVWGDAPSFTGLKVFNDIENDIDTEYRMVDDIAEENCIE